MSDPLTEWAKTQRIDSDLATIASAGYDVEARVLDLVVSELAKAVGVKPIVLVQGTPEHADFSSEERTNPRADAVRLELELRKAAAAPLAPGVEVVVSKVQRVKIGFLPGRFHDIRKPAEPDVGPWDGVGEWIKRTGIVVLVKGPRERERVAVFLVEPT